MRPLFVLIPAVVLAACSTVTREQPRPQPQVESRRSTAATLGIPPGHLPSVGQCRVWMPGVPPGQQRPPRPCAGIVRAAPAGSWIVYRPTKDRRLVHVLTVDEARMGGRVLIRVYAADGGGRFLREEHQRLEDSFDEEERPRGRRGRPN